MIGRCKQLLAAFLLMQLSLTCYASVTLGQAGTGPFAKVGKFEDLFFNRRLILEIS